MRNNLSPTTPSIKELRSIKTGDEPSRNKTMILSVNFRSYKGKIT